MCILFHPHTHTTHTPIHTQLLSEPRGHWLLITHWPPLRSEAWELSRSPIHPSAANWAGSAVRPMDSACSPGSFCPKMLFQPSGQRKDLPEGANLHWDEVFQESGQCLRVGHDWVTDTFTSFSLWPVLGGLTTPPNPKMRTHWVTPEQPAVPRGSSNLLPLPQRVSTLSSL